jgi:WD40 repeat protein
MDSSLILWDLEAAVPRTTLWASSGDVMSSVVVVPDEPMLVAGQSDGKLRVWIPE